MNQDSIPIDPRRHAFRADLADLQLEGRVTATRFVAGVLRQVHRPTAAMYKLPDASLGLENEALQGEMVRVFDEAQGWAWGQLVRDGYVGYIPAESLTAEIVAPTHRVRVPGTFVYPDATIKRATLAHLSLNAHVTVAGLSADARFAALATGGYVYARHLSAIDVPERDFVEVAETLIHTPYLWGGRTRLGLDCSGLVQLALEAAGVSCPRDSDMAAAELGERLEAPFDLDGLRRGDVVFWPGHCGIMIDAVMFVHANGHHMATMIEPLSQVVRRARKSGLIVAGTAGGPDVTAIRRISTTA